MVRKTEAWIHTAGANVALQSWLMDIFEYDHRVHWPMDTDASCAHWLSRNFRIRLNAAREWLHVAHRLQTLPKVSE